MVNTLNMNSRHTRKVRSGLGERILSGLTAVIFFLTSLDVSMAEGLSTSQPVSVGIESAMISQIKIPSKWGDIISRFEGDSKHVVIQIQDAHCNFEAQSNTARILEELFKQYGQDLRMINVEGSSGDLDTSLLSLFPDTQIKKQLGLYYLRQGKISGAEYLSIIKDKPLKMRGVEDLSLYFQNLKWFDRSLEFRLKADELIESLKKTLGELQEKVFNEDLRQFLRSEEDHKRGKRSLSNHTAILRELGDKKGVKVKDLKNVSLFLKTEEESGAMDFKKVDEERTKLVDQLLSKLS